MDPLRQKNRVCEISSGGSPNGPNLFFKQESTFSHFFVSFDFPGKPLHQSKNNVAQSCRELKGLPNALSWFAVAQKLRK